MDPSNRAPQEYGWDDGDSGAASGYDAVGDATALEHVPATGSAALVPARAVRGEIDLAVPRARAVRLVAGDFLVTLNPVDGSEIELCPPGSEAHGFPLPERNGPDRRSALRRAAMPPIPVGHLATDLPLMGRAQEREHLVDLLSRGRSVRLTGPSGSGRSVLLDAVAVDCAALAPDGVVRLSGYHRTSTDLLHALFATVHRADLRRPDRARLLEAVRGIGAVVVIDDVEFGGAALTDLLDAAPDCAFLISATPDVPAPAEETRIEELALGGLSRAVCRELLERAAHRPLSEDEAAWAGDLWFESEGLPLRFVQTATLMHRREPSRPQTDVFGGDGDAFAAFEPVGARAAALPTLAESAAPAGALAARLSDAAREALRIAVALGGELPHHGHLPALVGDRQADTALAELLGCGLVTAAGAHYRLAAGVALQLQTAGYGEGAARRAHDVAQHYVWWAGHGSVAHERVAAESDAVIAALAVLVADRGAASSRAATLLARTVAPAFAAAVHWSAWERALRHGQEAARLSGEVAQAAYFHHELGVLALCNDNPERARAELEASIGLRGVLADRKGAVTGRRALALVEDRATGHRADAEPAATPPSTSLALRSPAPVRPETARVEITRVGGPAARGARPRFDGDGARFQDGAPEFDARPQLAAPAAAPADLLVSRSADGDHGEGRHRAAHRAERKGPRRNVVAIGAGALLAAVLGTVVTLGSASHRDEDSVDRVRSEQPGSDDNEDLGTDDPTPSDEPETHPGSASAASDESPDTSAVTVQVPPGTASEGGHITSGPTHTGKPSDRPTKPTHKPTTKPPSHTGKPTEDPSGTPSQSPSSSPSQGVPESAEPSPSATSGSPSPTGQEPTPTATTV